MNSVTHVIIKKMSPQFVVADIDRSIEFYTQKLGFEVEFRYEDFYAGIVNQGFSIHLKSGNPVTDKRKNKGENQDLDLVFSVGGVEDLYNELVNKFIEVTQPLCDRPYGKEFYIADPDGYILAFLEEA